MKTTPPTPPKDRLIKGAGAAKGCCVLLLPAIGLVLIYLIF